MATIKKSKMAAMSYSLVGMLVTVAWLLVWGSFTSAYAVRIPQIPALEVCTPTLVKGDAVVEIASRALPSDPSLPGYFKVEIAVSFAPEAGGGYPEGTLEIRATMSEMHPEALLITAVTSEQLTATGKQSPTAFLSGRCKVQGFSGCRFWMMVADNNQGGKTPDIIGFLVVNGRGNRIAYGTGSVVDGDIYVSPG